MSDFLAIHERERFHELIDGEIVRKAEPTFEHGDAQVALGHSLFASRQRDGWWTALNVEVRFESDVCRPDLAGWRRERVPVRPSGAPVKDTPDFVCEILSPSNRRVDLVGKKRIYHRHKVGHYWIVDPDAETLSVNRWHADGYLEVLVAERGQKVRAEPFDAIELSVGLLFGDDEEATAR